jgi:hypothetical protein
MIGFGFGVELATRDLAVVEQSRKNGRWLDISLHKIESIAQASYLSPGVETTVVLGVCALVRLAFNVDCLSTVP